MVFRTPGRAGARRYGFFNPSIQNLLPFALLSSCTEGMGDSAAGGCRSRDSFNLLYDHRSMASSARGIPEIMIRFALTSLAVLIIIIGLIIFSTPLPFGTAMILIGCALLVSVSETAAARLTDWRLRYPRLNRFFAAFEDRAPGGLGRALRRTTPKPISRNGGQA